MLASVLLLAGPIGCTHDFDPPANGDASTLDDDDDGSIKADAPPPDAPIVDAEVRTDFLSPSGCGLAVPADAGAPNGGDCKDPSTWVCAKSCGEYQLLACFDRFRLAQRAIRCDAKGRCECQVGANAPVYCVAPESTTGRMGCGRAREMLMLHNCCAAR